MCQLGNAKVNAIYEYDIPSHVKKPTAESSRAVRESFIRMKYAQHAFVHPHPNFERPEIPLPAPNFSELLTPSKSPKALHGVGGSSPKSPTRRSFSPSLKIRSPKLRSHFGTLKGSSRPSSASDHTTPAESEDDQERPPDSQSGTMSILAENLKKLEKSGKLKSWGGSSQSLSDKIRSTARRSSRRLSTYAKAKLSGARERLRSKEKAVVGREVHSDAEDEDMATTSTPLLYSMSASTQNLSTYSTPPPKPPRTFATKRLSGVSASDDEGDLFKDSGDFSDILSAIKEMGVLCNPSAYEEGFDNDLPNGRIPDTSTSTSKLKKSESSPQLSHSKLTAIEPPNSQSNGNSPRLTPLNTISEDQTAKQEDCVEIEICDEIDANHLAVSSSSVDLPPDVGEISLNSSDSTEELKVSSAPLRRKIMLGTSASFDSALASSTLTNSDGNIPSSVQAVETAPSKRYSILSTTSAEFFSADSSEASGSKVPSVSVSPDIPSNLPAPENSQRAPSRSSVEDECFSTPPSTPTFPDSTRSTMDREVKSTNQVKDCDHVTKIVNGTEAVDGESEIVFENENLNVENKLTNQNEPQGQVTADDATGIATSPQLPETPTLFESQTSLTSPTRRKRSLTVSDSLPLSTLPHVYITRSKDDNFETECKSRSSDPLVSSFSQQDIIDILGSEQRKIDPAVGQTLAIPEEIEEEKDLSSAATSPDLSGQTGEVSDGSPVPSGGSPEDVEIPEPVEAIVIPDTVTPDEVCVCICIRLVSSCLSGPFTPPTDTTTLLVARYLLINAYKYMCAYTHV